MTELRHVGLSRFQGLCYIPAPMTPETTLTKEDIARELKPDEPLSIRSVERYIQIAEVEPVIKGSGRGKVARYAQADVAKIKTAYDAATTARENPQPAALVKTTPQALTTISDLVTGQGAGFQALASRLDPWPVWMTTKQALELSGLAPSWLYAGLRKGELAATGKRATRRIHRDSLRDFAEKIRDTEYLTELLKPA